MIFPEKKLNLWWRFSPFRTYAVVFTPLTSDQKTQLYVSVFSSFISIGYAFSTIDMFQGGKMLVKVPGYCKSYLTSIIPQGVLEL